MASAVYLGSSQRFVVASGRGSRDGLRAWDEQGPAAEVGSDFGRLFE
ncbi:hypothetical protein [Paraliomyxa miuraensis]|nr:hypothetical protein [Paraliomyxa miuraensis]MCX4239305.1 hypothetical protein [Paraliomyxa miuraensis]